jgi:hypothetical protein
MGRNVSVLNIPNERTGFSLYPFCGSDYNDNQEVGARNPDKEREGSNQEAGILPTERKRFLRKERSIFMKKKLSLLVALTMMLGSMAGLAEEAQQGPTEAELLAQPCEFAPI